MQDAPEARDERHVRWTGSTRTEGDNNSIIDLNVGLSLNVEG